MKEDRKFNLLLRASVFDVHSWTWRGHSQTSHCGSLQGCLPGSRPTASTVLFTDGPIPTPRVFCSHSA